MKNPGTGINLSRRKMLFKIIRVATSKLIKGEYQYANVSEITTEELLDRTKSDQPPLIIDTRSHKEFNTGFGHIPNSRLIPMMDLVGSFNDLDGFKSKIKTLEAQLDQIAAFKGTEVITICPGGGFSLIAAEIMAEAGFQDVKSLSGGIDEWFMKDYPTSLP